MDSLEFGGSDYFVEMKDSRSSFSAQPSLYPQLGSINNLAAVPAGIEMPSYAVIEGFSSSITGHIPSSNHSLPHGDGSYVDPLPNSLCSKTRVEGGILSYTDVPHSVSVPLYAQPRTMADPLSPPSLGFTYEQQRFGIGMTYKLSEGSSEKENYDIRSLVRDEDCGDTSESSNDSGETIKEWGARKCGSSQRDYRQRLQHQFQNLLCILPPLEEERGGIGLRSHQSRGAKRKLKLRGKHGYDEDNVEGISKQGEKPRGREYIVKVNKGDILQQVTKYIQTLEQEIAGLEQDNIKLSLLRKQYINFINYY
ncbi:uncharacterized protein PAC_18736 [Phialocephala subalpina]|uniref:Uncharacterized protein n=1 Tax=Phialocephala subalpina TaxID=576137 RepID=A0A1L7XUY5_9HELO|nr:uncharacterized protein PAC_18736 [Phialocephala subalpina]